MWTKKFSQLSKNDTAIAGGKGASLGEMARASLPVPPGFVILADAFEKFLEETDLNVEIDAKLKKINRQDINSVDRASNEIRDLIGDAKFPKNIGDEILKEFSRLKLKYIAVRSSATVEDSSAASWAGELESYLNTTKNNLLENIKKCWASLFTPRAIFYRSEKKLNKTKVSVAVVIQKMIQSEVSGVCFTVHPVTQDRNQMIIEAVFGLGESLVQGLATPDSYVIEKDSLKLVDVNVNGQGKRNKQKLSEKQIRELAKICVRIEKHFKTPQDIEWAFAKNKFYIVQSRPITTLNK